MNSIYLETGRVDTQNMRDLVHYCKNLEDQVEHMMGVGNSSASETQDMIDNQGRDNSEGVQEEVH